jgi:hypothetical protein
MKAKEEYEGKVLQDQKKQERLQFARRQKQHQDVQFRRMSQQRELVKEKEIELHREEAEFVSGLKRKTIKHIQENDTGKNK